MFVGLFSREFNSYHTWYILINSMLFVARRRGFIPHTRVYVYEFNVVLGITRGASLVLYLVHVQGSPPGCAYYGAP